MFSYFVHNFMKKYAYSKASKTYLSITNNVSQSYDIVIYNYRCDIAINNKYQ